VKDNAAVVAFPFCIVFRNLLQVGRYSTLVRASFSVC
jgi:hypothetical protein